MHCCARPFVDTHKLSRRVPARRPRAAAAFIVSRRSPPERSCLPPPPPTSPSPTPLLPSARKLAGGGLVRYAFSPIVCPARTARQRREHAGLTTLRATKINLGVRDPFATRAIARRHPRFRISRAVACITRGFVGIQDCFPPASRISPGKEETRASRAEGSAFGQPAGRLSCFRFRHPLMKPRHCGIHHSSDRIRVAPSASSEGFQRNGTV